LLCGKKSWRSEGIMKPSMEPAETRGRLKYPLEVAHKARSSLCLGLEDVRHRALAAALEIAHIPEDQLPADLREEWRAILKLANRYDGPRRLRKATGRKLAEQIYEFCRGIETRYSEARA
jgi:hypothetical protein